LDAPPVPWMHGAAGITAGAISMTMFYPLDLIRTRKHAETANGDRGLRSIRQVYEADGVRGMYRGVKLAVTAHSVGWGMYLTFFRTFQQGLARQNGGNSTTGDFVSAIGAACVTSTLITPLNVMKTRRQLSDKKTGGGGSGVISGLHRMVKREGYSALLKGVGPQILLSSHTTIQVALYECIKRKMWGSEDAPMMGVAMASASSKAFASALCNPLEVCRTRLQDKRNTGTAEYGSMRAAFGTIWRTEGIRGLYRGVGVNVCRVVPTTVVAFIVYEQVLHVMKRQSARSRQPAVAAPSGEAATAAR
jgi:solute carrier family 25 folate transporter 32